MKKLWQYQGLQLPNTPKQPTSVDPCACDDEPHPKPHTISPSLLPPKTGKIYRMKTPQTQRLQLQKFLSKECSVLYLLLFFS